MLWLFVWESFLVAFKFHFLGPECHLVDREERKKGKSPLHAEKCMGWVSSVHTGQNNVILAAFRLFGGRRSFYITLVVSLCVTFFVRVYGIVRIFLAQPKGSANPILGSEPKNGEIEMKAVVCSFKLLNFDSFREAASISSGSTAGKRNTNERIAGLFGCAVWQGCVPSCWLTGVFVSFCQFNNEIVCLTKGTLKGTVEADSRGKACHQPITLHKRAFMLYSTHLCALSTLTNITFMEVFQNKDSSCMYFTVPQSTSCGFSIMSHPNDPQF